MLRRVRNLNGGLETYLTFFRPEARGLKPLPLVELGFRCQVLWSDRRLHSPGRSVTPKETFVVDPGRISRLHMFAFFWNRNRRISASSTQGPSFDCLPVT